MQIPLTQPPELPWLFAGVFATLAIASVVGWHLWRTVAQRRPHAAIDNLNARIKAWWVMVLAMAVAFAFGTTGVTVAFAMVAFVALREYVSLSNTRRSDYRVLALAFYVILPLQYVLAALAPLALFATLVPLFALLGVPVLVMLSGDGAYRRERTLRIQFGVIVCIYCLSFIPALMALRLAGCEDRNLLLVGWLLLVVQASDVLQYIWGKMLGRRKIAPALSPSKTVEGFVGGIATATGLGVALHWMTPFTPWQACGVGVIVTLAGFAGGLCMSAAKRSRGIKDWGTTIAGHGGMLDRVDSLIIAAPIYFCILRYGWQA